MTEDEWEKVKDHELVDEVHARGIEAYIDCDCSYEMEEAVEEYIRDTPDTVEVDDFRVLCDIYKTKNPEALDKALSDMFYEVLGVIV